MDTSFQQLFFTDDGNWQAAASLLRDF